MKRVSFTGCRCKVCLFSRKVESIQENLPAKDRAIIEELLLKWEHEATDATYYRMKLAGTWPDG